MFGDEHFLHLHILVKFLPRELLRVTFIDCNSNLEVSQCCADLLKLPEVSA